MDSQAAANPLREKLVKGVGYQKTGAFEKAQRCYKSVLKKAPNNPDALHLLGVTYRQMGNPKRALEYIQKAINQNPKQSAFYANLARAMMDVGTDPDSLLAVAEKALTLNPQEREAINIKGIALTKLGQHSDAELIFQKLIVADPNYIEAYQNYGTLLIEAEKSDKAVPFFGKAILLNPDNPNNYVQRARCRLVNKEFEQSQYELTEALALFPGNSEVLHEAARLLFTMNETKLAVGYAQQAVDSDPRNVHKWVTLGVNQLMMGDNPIALETLKAAKRLAPAELKSVDWNLSLAHLANGDLATGWDLHKLRFQDPAAKVMRRTFEVPAWEGEDISDKTVLVWADQGLGDALKAGTMVPDLMARAKKVIVELSDKGAKLFQYSFPDANCRAAQMNRQLEATAHDYDVHANITDLASFFRRDLESYRKVNYPVFSFEKERARGYLSRLKGHNEKPVIGMSWRSGNLAVNRARFYLSSVAYAPILESRDAIFVNLQYKTTDKELAYLNTKFDGKFNNFEDVDLFDDLLGVAALTACCDLVVSANTSVADMAGVLDIPAVRFGQHEPPLTLGQDTVVPWYPSMIYRHPYLDKPCSDFVPEIIAEIDRQLADWTPERRNTRLDL